MASGAAVWLSETKAVYFDNATSKRDYRVQLRGNKSVVLFGIYLFVMIAVAMVVYTQSGHGARFEVVEAQEKLKSFYSTISYLLAGLVSLVAPALTATTIVVERQRRSLDLVFSAPVSPKYYLVGKMMSSFRYTWMLLILSLPITAACVVMGGASWVDVVTSYILLSFQALIMTSVGLMLSTLAQKPVSAVIWSYAASIVYLIITLYLSVFAMPGAFMRGAANSEQPFFVALNPFLIQQVIATHTTMFGHAIPNWVLVGIFAVLISKFCLLGAGIMLSPQPTKEIRSLRIHGLVYATAILFYVAAISSSLMPSMGLFAFTINADFAGRFLFWILAPLFLVLPFLSSFGVDSERRFWPNGFFSIRRLLDGSPAGGLPYLLAFIGACGLAIWLGMWYGAHHRPGYSFAAWVLYTMAFWTVFWSFGRFASSFFAGLRAARTMQFASFLLFMAVPMPLLGALTSTGPGSNDASLWNVFPLRPLFIAAPIAQRVAVEWALGMALFAVMVTASAEIRTRSKLARLKEKYEAVLASA